MSLQHVQDWAAVASAAAASLQSGASPQAVTSGNTVLVFVWTEQNTTVSGGTDTAGNTYAPDATIDNPTFHDRCTILRASNVAGGSSVKITVNVSPNAFISFTAAEFRGVLLTNSLDGAGSTNTGAGTVSPSAGAFSTGNANDLLITTFAISHCTTATEPSGYTLVGKVVNSGNECGAAAYQIVSSTQTNVNPTWTTTGAGSGDRWAAVALAYKAATVIAGLVSATCYEVRPAGSGAADTNGGGYSAGSTGTDYSQQDAPQYSFTDLASSNGTSAAPAVTSASHSFANADVGNWINVSAGTNWTQGLYQIVSVSGGAATLNASCGSSAGLTGGTWALGGALATPAKAASVAVGGNIVFVKNGTYGQATSTTLSVVGGGNKAMPIRFIGYYRTRGDIVPGAGNSFDNNPHRPVLQISSGSGVVAFDLTGSWPVTLENLVIDCNSKSTSTGVKNEMTGTGVTVYNCTIKNFTTHGINNTGNNTATDVFESEITGGTSAATASLAMAVGVNFIGWNYLHDNACPGVIDLATFWNNLYFGCVLVSNTGASSDGILSGGAAVLCCTIYASGRHGINTNDSAWTLSLLTNNVLANSGGYGFQGYTAAGVPAMSYHDGNGYYNNSLGTRNFADDTTVNPQNGVAPYTNVRDVSPGANPFINPTVGNLQLNPANPGGSQLRSVGMPGLVPGDLSPGAIDFGAFQHRPAPPPLPPPSPQSPPPSTDVCRGNHSGGGYTWAPLTDCPPVEV